MMHVLDLDLDFFLADCCPLAKPGQRPVLAGHEPWSESEVCHFLEAHCGLSAEHPTRGAIFETHDAALSFWRDRMASGDLVAPSTSHMWMRTAISASESPVPAMC